jgi:hypothetical protein
MKMIVTNETRRCVRGAARGIPNFFLAPTFLIRRLWRAAHTMQLSRMMACKFLPPVENNQSALRASAFLHLSLSRGAQLIYRVMQVRAALCARRWPFKETSLRVASQFCES